MATEEPKCQICGELSTTDHTIPTCDSHKQPLTDGINALVQKLISELPPPPEPAEPTQDKYGIEFLYDRPKNGRIIYMDMDNPTKDAFFRNEENANLKKGLFGGWTATGTKEKAQVRLELWADPAIRDCEITYYSKYLSDYGPGIKDPGAYAHQCYRGGGSHSTTLDGQEGAAYKARIRKDKKVTVVKEVRHPDYTSSVGSLMALSESPKNRFIGVKLVVYNLKEKINGRIPVKIEVWIDEVGMNAKGEFEETAQTWKKYAEYTDKGGWKAGTGGGNPPIEIGNTGKRKADEILNTPKGAVRNKGNTAVYRTDGAMTELKYFSFAEIVNPTGAE